MKKYLHKAIRREKPRAVRGSLNVSRRLRELLVFTRYDYRSSHYIIHTYISS